MLRSSVRKGIRKQTREYPLGYNIKIYKIMEHSRPDIVVFEKKTRSCKIVLVACPFDTGVVEKEGKCRQVSRFGMRIEGDLELW